jgi:CHASE2 domain-containing sensor protein
MAFLDKHRQPGKTELQVFGLLLALFAGFVGALLRWKLGHPTAAAVTWGLGGLAALFYYAAPALRRPMIRAWVTLTFPLGWLVSHVVLALVYYGIFTPIGRIQRLFGRDAMQRRPDPRTTSYWHERKTKRDPASYFKQS